ncbi:hypothetical protein TrCOL_g13883 [Triparma columacea]|uniref:Uncharacterized protein n=1 Tax=Triparma columacea TaxID=722753 RepID=A0A9W7GCJ7_9STRA|nr:hypothetical protein TrCOL_g13883 [Triparma columacea]
MASPGEKSTPRKKLDSALMLDEQLNNSHDMEEEENSGAGKFEPKPPRREEKREYKAKVREVADELVKGVIGNFEKFGVGGAGHK